MKYMLLIYTAPGSLDNLGEDERKSISAEYFAISDIPAVVDGAQLAGVDTATTVRVPNGSALATDGPFADTKECLAGYYLVDADNIDTAIDIAAKVPASRLGGAVEVRPLVY